MLNISCGSAEVRIQAHLFLTMIPSGIPGIEAPEKTFFGTISLSHKSAIHHLSDSRQKEVIQLVHDRLVGSLHDPDKNVAPTGKFAVAYCQNMLLRGNDVSWHAKRTAVLDCVKEYDEKIDVIGFGELRPGPLYAMQDQQSTDEREAAFDANLNLMESQLNTEEGEEDEVQRVVREVIRKARTDPHYRKNFMSNTERTLLSLEQLIEYVKGCVTFVSGKQELFQDSEASVVRGMGLPWITLSYKHESYHGDYRISLDKLQRIWKTVAIHTGVDDFCLWVDHVMRLRKYSTRNWYAVGIEPYAVGRVLRYLRKPYDGPESLIDINPGLWLSCEAILGISNRGLYCIREGEDSVEVIDSGIGLGSKAAVRILAFCFMNGRLWTKKVFYQEDSQGLVNWAMCVIIAGFNSQFLDVPTLKQLIPDMLALESKPEIFNRFERHLGVMAFVHRPTEAGKWRGIRCTIPFLNLLHVEIDREFERSRCKIFGCDQCGKKLAVLECFRGDCQVWKPVSISGLESNVTGPEGHVHLTLKLSPVESTMLRVSETLEGLSHIGGGFLVICDSMRLIKDMELKDIQWVPCDCPGMEDN